jgi:hypothetical protein
MRNPTLLGTDAGILEGRAKACLTRDSCLAESADVADVSVAAADEVFDDRPRTCCVIRGD